ncbi:hypothetical protein N7457_005525 [Penicillium paradoxum]|uniref:uncharacterized protein n=1 Tax=Penicillium paradoxum TaxID=176176 RepID=UPI0025484D1C|nr:uncharacterized protein N7457_005525 [Penicillium paradoxum]KAJ5780365.1 hypothetical protein N7457_005525 [Penicillium paradoxum]
MTSKFESLMQALPDAEIFVPGYLGYEDRLKRWSASCIKPAAIIVCPRNAFEVSIALRYAVEHRVFPLAVCGGGHSTSGDNCSSGGMVIDLRKIRSTSVDLERQTVTFGGGCTWDDVNCALWNHGLATVGGTVGDTGVGGLILGGGYGYLTGRRGLALDCLVSCEVVLANGDVVTASKEKNAELFWALRGAGANFGIVTHFTSQGYPQGDSWAGFLGYQPQKLPALVEFGNRFMAAMDGNSMFSLIIGNFIPKNGSGIMALVFYNGPEEEGKKFFKPLFDLEPLADTTSMVSYPDLNMMFNRYPRGPDGRHLLGGANFTFPLDVNAAQEISDYFWETTKKAENENLRGSTIAFEYYPTQQIRQVAIGETAFANRGQFAPICITVNWTDESKDKSARLLLRNISRYITDRVAWKGDENSDGTSVYGNYLSEPFDFLLRFGTSRLVAKSYLGSITKAEKVYGPNSPRLRKLKKKYDPNHVFRKIVNLSPVGKGQLLE